MLSLLLRLPRFVWRKLHIWNLNSKFGGRLQIGLNTRIASPARIHLIGDTSLISIGSGVSIEEDTWLNVAGTCEIGNDSYISIRCLIGSEMKVKIGDRVAVGPNVTIIDTNKNYGNLSMPILAQGGKSAPILIQDDCWLGANVVVLAGSELGAHTVVAAGAVVRGKFPPNVVLAGNPAKVVKTLGDKP